MHMGVSSFWMGCVLTVFHIFVRYQQVDAENANQVTPFCPNKEMA